LVPSKRREPIILIFHITTQKNRQHLFFASSEELASVAYHTGVRIMELMIVGETKLSVKITG